jgi:maleate isomerase
VQEDVVALCPDGVGVHFTRAAIPDSITSETLAAQADLLAPAAASLLPDGSLDVVCYACTSGSLVIGEDRVHAELARGAPNAKTTSIIASVIKGLRALGIRRLAVATPYISEINQREARYLDRAGFDVLSITGLDIERDSDMVRVSPAFIRDFAISVDRPDADAVFISCGALRSLDVVEDIEDRLGKPIVTSNQAMIWDCLRLAGIDDPIEGYGRLLRGPALRGS